MQVDGWYLYIIKWCFEFLNISFWVQCSKSRQSILLPFLHLVFPIKLNSLHPHSHIHETLAPPPRPRERRPLLSPIPFSPLASSSLPTSGTSPTEDRAREQVSSPTRVRVTPVFPKKTKCKPICMPGSSFMHIVTYKWITVQYHVRKRKIIRDLHFILETKAPNITSSWLGVELHNIFSKLHSSFLFLSNIVYRKGEHLSYSASVGKGWMQRLYSGLGSKNLAF
jgi:hypothetical protein